MGKKPKNNTKKKALAVGGVSMFGGKNPFASRKQEESSEEEVEEDKSEDDSKLTASNGDIRSLAQPPPHAMPTFNIAVQPDSEEQPVSFDDLPSSTHVILTSNKHRAKLPSRRRPTVRGVHSNGHSANGNGHAIEGSGNNNIDTGNESLSLPSEENDYDGDESEMSYSQIKRGRRSMKRRQPSRNTLLSPIAHKVSDSDEKEIVHSTKCDPGIDIGSLLAAEQKKEEEKERERQEELKRLEVERLRLEKQKQEEERKRMEEERIKQEKELKLRENKRSKNSKNWKKKRREKKWN